MKPYVNIITLELSASVDRRKATVPIKLPQMHAARHPNLLENALTIGPANQKRKRKKLNKRNEN